MTSDNSVKRSRRLLGIYWLYKVLNGGSIAKTTLNTLKIEANAFIIASDVKNVNGQGYTLERVWMNRKH